MKTDHVRVRREAGEPPQPAEPQRVDQVPREATKPIVLDFLGSIGKRPELGVLISLVVVSLVFVVLSGGKFATVRNIASLLAISAELGIVTLGMAFILISGEIDLSVGSVFGMSALFFVLLSNLVGSVPAFLVAVGLACLVGLCNGFITTRTEVPSLIATLGMMMFIRGIIFFTTGGFTRSFSSTDFFIEALGGRFAGRFHTSVLWFVAVAVIFGVILRLTRYGNAVFAVGGNREVARALGINVDRVRLTNFILCSSLAGFAGTISASRFHTAAATTGELMELEAIAAAVMGGCLLTGGYGTIAGAFIGALLIPAVRAGLILSGAPGYWYQAFIGIVLVAASIINLSVIRRAVSK
ncbi:MAG: ABC transporter permease [Anaerolineae bacterium]